MVDKRGRLWTEGAQERGGRWAGGEVVGGEAAPHEGRVDGG